MLNHKKEHLPMCSFYFFIFVLSLLAQSSASAQPQNCTASTIKDLRFDGSGNYPFGFPQLNLSPRIAVVGQGANGKEVEIKEIIRYVKSSNQGTEQVKLIKQIAPKSKIIDIGIQDSTGAASCENIRNAINTAIDFAADVILIVSELPAGNYGINTSIARAIALDIPVIIPAGNDSTEVSIHPAYPELIRIGAVGKSEKLISFSNDGPLSFVDFGFGIDRVGTASAAAVASGKVGLYKRLHPGLSVKELIELMKSEGRKTVNGYYLIQVPWEDVDKERNGRIGSVLFMLAIAGLILMKF